MLKRRELLKLWAAGGAAALLPIGYQKHQKLGFNKAFSKDSEFTSFAFQSPTVTPFKDPLPLPSVIQPSAPFEAPEWDRFIEAGKTSFYKVVSEQRQVQFHSELPPTSIWGYRPENVPHGDWNFALGPTFKVNICQDIHAGLIVRHINELPDEVEGFGHPETSVHLHGGHHPSRSDGFPGNIDGERHFLFGPGEHYNYCYPMLDVGFLDGVTEPSERPSTLWYHDHTEDFTAVNVYKGLAGLHLVFEDPEAPSIEPLDTGDETSVDLDGNSVGLHLPSGPNGECDIPLVLQDKSFFDDGSLFYNSFDHDGFLGDQFLVNGAIQPYLEVKRRKYRFRFLNGSNARFYQICLSNAEDRSQPFDMIGNEGGLFSQTLRDQETFLFCPAERYEIVIDFSRYQRGDMLYFEDHLGQDDGRGPDGDFDEPKLRKRTRLLQLRVGEDAEDPSEVPDILRPFEPISPEMLASAEVKTFEFERRQGAWQINHQFFDRNNPLTVSQQGMPEIWRLVNTSGGWWHPIHIHSEFVRVISRNGKLPPLRERDGIAKKDTIILGPNDEVEVFLRFRDYPGPFVFHCHNIEHEDMFMMGRVDIV